MLTSLRHHRAVATALDGLDAAARANSAGIPHEMILIDLYRSLWALDSLTGQTTPDDVLNLIFNLLHREIAFRGFQAAIQLRGLIKGLLDYDT